MTKEEFIESIKSNDNTRIIQHLSDIRLDLEKQKENYCLIVDLFYNTKDVDILNQIDWFFFSYLHKSQDEEDFFKITNHKNYSFNLIKMHSHIFQSMFQNNNISSKLYKHFILKGAKKHLKELCQLITLKIDINSVDLSVDEKIAIFYKTMGIVCADVKNSMKICFDILIDDELIKKDKDLLLTFARWYGWNWISTSGKFINQCKPETDSQKQLLEYLKLYIEGVREENNRENLSKDFEIDMEIIRAKQRIDKEQSEEISKNAEDASIFGKLFPRTHILKGLKVSNITDTANGVCINKPIPMQEFSFEYELPIDLKMSPIDFEDTLDYLLAGGKYETNN